jgi:hypothetical protein
LLCVIAAKLFLAGFSRAQLQRVFLDNDALEKKDSIKKTDVQMSGFFSRSLFPLLLELREKGVHACVKVVQ